MPGCVLRIGTKTSDVDRAIEASGLRPLKVFRKGTPKFLARRLWPRSLDSTWTSVRAPALSAKCVTQSGSYGGMNLAFVGYAV